MHIVTHIIIGGTVRHRIKWAMDSNNQPMFQAALAASDAALGKGIWTSGR